MPKNYSYYPASAEVESYIKGWKKRKHAEFGFDDPLREKVRGIVGEQVYDFKRDPPGRRIKFSTAFCQPLVWFDGEELRLGGVRDYDPLTQTGTFVHETEGGLLTVPNVHSYYVFVEAYDKYLPCRYNWQPEEECLKSVILAAIVRTEEGFDIQVYKNTELILEIDNVYEYLYVSDFEKAPFSSRRGYFIFSRQSGNRFQNYHCDIETLSITELDPSSGAPGWVYYHPMGLAKHSYGLQTWYQNKELRHTLIPDSPIGKAEMITVVVNLDNSKTGQVIAEFIKGADKTKVIKNYFEEDQTLNIAATYVGRVLDVKFLYYCSTKAPQLFGGAVFGISIDALERGTLNHWREYDSVYRYSECEYKRMKQLNVDLYKMCGEKKRPGFLPEGIYNSCVSSSVMILLMQHYVGPSQGIAGWGVADDRKIDFSVEKERYKSIFGSLASKGNLSTKWKSEYELYNVVHSLYQDAIYQYSVEWLGRQSLDVFIPSINLGIEYQGEQHYRPIPLFGGEEGLRGVQQRDRKKRQLCADNNVYLLEWRYDEPISLPVLKRKLVESGIVEERYIPKASDPGEERRGTRAAKAAKKREPRKNEPKKNTKKKYVKREPEGPVKPPARGECEKAIREYAAAHPDATYSEIQRFVGVSRPTIIKYLGKSKYRGHPKGQ